MGDTRKSEERSTLGRPARCTFSATHVVVVCVRGERLRTTSALTHPELGPLPLLPVDDGLIGRLLAWLHGELIYPVIPGGVSGGGVHIGFYAPADAERIAEWLRAQDVTEVAYEDQR